MPTARAQHVDRRIRRVQTARQSQRCLRLGVKSHQRAGIRLSTASSPPATGSRSCTAVIRAPTPSRAPYRPQRTRSAAQTDRRAACNSFATVVTIRAPVAPNGCPIEMDPPITFNRLSGIDLTNRRTESRALRPILGGESLNVAQHLRGKRLVHIDEIHILAASIPHVSKQPGAANTGACSNCSLGSIAAYAYDRINAIGA